MSSLVNMLSSVCVFMAVTRGRWEVLQYRLATLALRALQMIRGSLRAKFVILIVSLQIAMMGAVTLVMEYHQRRAILDQTRLRALSIAESLAALSEGHFLSYNFIKLEQAMENVTADNVHVMYAVAHLHDGKVAAFSGRDDLQGKTLDDPISRRALQATEALVQGISLLESSEPGYEIAIPVFIVRSPKKWGTIRVGYSLKHAYGLIYQTRRDLILLSLAAILGATILAICLAMRIAQPIAQLVLGVDAFAGGVYDRPIRVDSRDELGYLARAFEQMRSTLQSHIASLAEEKHCLEAANHRLQETQQQLIQSERLAAVGKVAARVAHEVNNPLAIIKTAVRIIRNQLRPDSPTTGSLQMIEEEISRIARIIQELLESSHPTPPAQELVQINTVIVGLEQVLEHDLREQQIGLKVSLEPALPQALISPDQLKQVILNLVRNAEHAMPQGG
jgi:signal transduction histidine kinase